MILYNVTVKIDSNTEADWVNWMKTVHIPDVMNTGFFSSNRFLKLLNPNESDGVTYSIQYFCNCIEDLESYHRDYAPTLQQKHTQRYEGKFVAFRTLMESI